MKPVSKSDSPALRCCARDAAACCGTYAWRSETSATKARCLRYVKRRRIPSHCSPSTRGGRWTKSRTARRSLFRALLQVLSRHRPVITQLRPDCLDLFGRDERRFVAPGIPDVTQRRSDVAIRERTAHCGHGLVPFLTLDDNRASQPKERDGNHPIRALRVHPFRADQRWKLAGLAHAVNLMTDRKSVV